MGAAFLLLSSFTTFPSRLQETPYIEPRYHLKKLVCVDLLQLAHKRFARARHLTKRRGKSECMQNVEPSPPPPYPPDV